MRIKTAMVIPGGWKFVIEGCTVEASGYPELVEAVKNWKLQNGRPLGNIEKEIEDQVCALYPLNCHPIFGGIQVQIYDVAPRNISQRFVDNITTWATGIYQRAEAKSLVDEGEAARRANICGVCPNNKRWQEGCATCQQNLERLGALIRNGKDVPLHKQLNACAVLSHDNRTAIWLTKNVLGNRDAVPNNCWLK